MRKSFDVDVFIACMAFMNILTLINISEIVNEKGRFGFVPGAYGLAVYTLPLPCVLLMLSVFLWSAKRWALIAYTVILLGFGYLFVYSSSILSGVLQCFFLFFVYLYGWNSFKKKKRRKIALP